MSIKISFLTMLALTTTIGCSGEAPKANDSDEGSEPSQEDTGSDSSGEDDGDTGGDSDDTGADTGEGDETGDVDTGLGGDDIQAPPTHEAFWALALDARDDRIQAFSVDASEWTGLEGEQGSTLFFWPNTFSTRDGSLVTGEIQIELIEIFDKGSMLVTDMPSGGLQGTGDVAQLISGGEHYVGATQDGEELTMNSSFELTAPVENTGGADFGMGLFRAEAVGDAPADFDPTRPVDSDLGDQVLWVEQVVGGDVFGVNRGEDGAEGGVDGADTTYWMLSDQFGWTNIDRWYSDPRPKTTINVTVPEGWDDTNSAVYLSYDGEPTALARMDTYDDATGFFSEHYGLIPIGLEVHLIFVTESEGEWSYAIQGATIVDGHLSSFESAEEFIEIDTEGLVNAINALP